MVDVVEIVPYRCTFPSPSRWAAPVVTKSYRKDEEEIEISSRIQRSTQYAPNFRRQSRQTSESWYRTQ